MRRIPNKICWSDITNNNINSILDSQSIIDLAISADIFNQILYKINYDGFVEQTDPLCAGRCWLTSVGHSRKFTAEIGLFMTMSFLTTAIPARISAFSQLSEHFPSVGA